MKEEISLDVYLDYAATTPVEEEVLKAMHPFWQECFGNPSSPHRLGLEAEKALSISRRFLAQAFQIKQRELIFTSGGTESNNLAILGFGRNQREPGHIITTAIEHSSVLNAIDYLVADYGWQVTKLNVNSQGLIDLKDLTKAILPKTRLISIMLVNNEIGSIQDLAGISKAIEEKSRELGTKIVLHVDACQALGILPINIAKHKIHLLSLSGHKIHGPKGTGILYCNQQIRLKPLFFGGGQEQGVRSGSENIPGIVGLTKACQLSLATDIAKLNRLKTNFMTELKTIPDSYFNSPVHGAPHIINIGFFGVKAEVLVHFLEQKGVYVSIGAACSSRKSSISHVLQAIGLTETQAAASIRISLSQRLSDEELDYAAKTIKTAVAEIRNIYGGG